MRNDGFLSGVMAGMALGALMVVAMAPQIREPVMDGAGQMGDRMRGMWKRGAHMADDMWPGDPG